MEGVVAILADLGLSHLLRLSGGIEGWETFKGGSGGSPREDKADVSPGQSEEVSVPVDEDAAASFSREKLGEGETGTEETDALLIGEFARSAVAGNRGGGTDEGGRSRQGGGGEAAAAAAASSNYRATGEVRNTAAGVSRGKLTGQASSSLPASPPMPGSSTITRRQEQQQQQRSPGFQKEHMAVTGRVRDWASILSPGEQQRLGIARVLYHRPAIAFLDESTSAVTEATEYKVYALMRATGVTVVGVGHRASLRRLHQRVLALGGAPGGEWELCDL